MGQLVQVGLGTFGLVTLIVSVVVALGNRQIRREHIEHLEAALRLEKVEAEDRAQRDDMRIKDLRQQVEELRGKVDFLTGDLAGKLGEKIGDRIAVTVLRSLRERGNHG